MKSLTKILNFNNGGSVSYQTHDFRDEVWTVATGTGRLVLDGIFSDIKRGDVINIKAGQKHAVKGIDNLQIIEVQLGSELSEFDIQRYDLTWK
jgi:mannose-1-phosphate guanylyltransferase